MRIQYFFLAVLLVLSAKVFADKWQIGPNGTVVTEAEDTQDVLGINICDAVIIFAAPSSDVSDGTAVRIKPQMRVDFISPWEGDVVARVKNGLMIASISMSPEFLKELVSGKILRVKWSETSYSRFSLDGLISALKQVECSNEEPNYNKDSEYFKDSDYFT